MTRSQLCASDSFALFNLLTSEELLDEVEKLLPEHREPLFSPTEVLSMFVSQTLSEDRSCQKVVNDSAVRRAKSGMSQCSSNTSAFCRARCRLPLALPCKLGKHIARMIGEHIPLAWLWRGRPVRLVDGAVFAMPDTEENQKTYPQPTSQKEGLGFPQCRNVGLICLASGALLDCATGACRGKGNDEQSLLRSMLGGLERDDVLLGDAFYATYFLLCALRAKGVDGVFEQHGARARKTDFRRGKRLGTKDHIVEWKKPKIQARVDGQEKL